MVGQATHHEHRLQCVLPLPLLGSHYNYIPTHCLKNLKIKCYIHHMSCPAVVVYTRRSFDKFVIFSVNKFASRSIVVQSHLLIRQSLSTRDLFVFHRCTNANCVNNFNFANLVTSLGRPTTAIALPSDTTTCIIHRQSIDNQSK